MKTIISIGLCTLLIGCAVVERVDFQPQVGHRIGVLNLVEKQLSHVHVGTTVFNNRTTLHEPHGLDLPQYINDGVVSQLQNWDVEVVQLTSDDMPFQTERSLLHAGGSGLDIRSAYREPIESFMNARDIDLLIVFESRSLNDPIGGSTVHFSGFGLYTRAFFGMQSGHPYSLIWGYGIASDPYGLAHATWIQSDRTVEFTEINEFTIEELEEAIRELTDKLVHETLAGLNLQ